MRRSLNGRAFARSAAGALLAAAVWALAPRGAAHAQVPSAAASPAPAVTATSSAGPLPSPAPEGVPSPAAPAPVPASTPTQPPIVVDPPSAAIALGRSAVLRVSSVLGQVTAAVADPAIADAAVDQTARTVTVTAKALGATKVTITDERGLSRDVPILVALPAGEIPAFASIRISGNPASSGFVAETAALAARRVLKVRANTTVTVGNPIVTAPLEQGDKREVNVPALITGDGYITASGMVRVLVENYAQPRLPPSFLMVSDFPEKLTSNGLLFHSDIQPFEDARFLYYHYNPHTAPDRRIVLYVQNTSSVPSAIQLISGMAGPSPNEIEVGHLSTERFLTRSSQSEGIILSIPPGETIVALDQLMPPGSVVSNLMELRELLGGTLHIDLIAQDANAPFDVTKSTHSLLGSDVPHARGVYKPPEFYFEPPVYDTAGPNLEIPIGQIPVQELREGQVLAGDYGVLQQITIRIVNTNRSNPAQIALYANPRGGRATGTFIIDGVLVRAHAMAAFGHYKLREYNVPPGGFIRTTIVTMPEGGSSYPVRLIVGPDDGSSSPGSVTSHIY
jgi:hypothetical protein